MQKSRQLKDYIAIFFRGILMGAADAVPGVSGGTIAFITGIYEELIESIRRFDLHALSLLLKRDFNELWTYVNASFLLSLLAGILVSLASAAHLVLFMLEQYPEILWAFFFGLILASTWVVSGHIPKWDFQLTLLFMVGAALAYALTRLAPTEIEVTSLTIFCAGAIAICAMILPGISGSFILLLLGMYSTIFGAIKGFDLNVIGLFLLGCIVGIMSFSRVLNWLFHHYRSVTLALMSGFLLGSLNKVWPWKYTSAYTINRHGEPVPVTQHNVSPLSYESLTGESSFLLMSIMAFTIGGLMVIFMEKGASSQR